MRAYLGRVDSSGLQRLVHEDLVPRDLLQELVRVWTTSTTSVIRTIVAEDDAEAIRRELAADRHDFACTLLLNRAVEILSLGPIARELSATP